MSDHIKSADLCNRCRFEYFRHCNGNMCNSCVGCVMDGTGKPGVCKCLEIEQNTPCPYFVEDTEK